MAPAQRDALLGFLALSDRLKHVERAAMTGPRRENSAEHAWQVALCAVLLHGEAPDPKPDLARVLSMIVVHDLVEIEAGDTFAFDEQGLLTQAAREAEAARRLFATLPPALGDDVALLWAEFEAGVTPEARFAMGCDRLQGFAQQVQCGAPAWKAIALTEERSLMRMGPAIALGAPFAAPILHLYEIALERGLLLP